MAISSFLGSSALLPAGLGFRNVLINGAFNINQRGLTTTTADGYGFDRWAKYSSTGTVTYSSQSFTPGALSFLELEKYVSIDVTGQSGAGAEAVLYQPIEDVRTCAGKTAVLSFWAKSASGTPKIGVELRQAFGSGGSPSAEVQTAGGSVTISTSWAKYSLTIAVPSISGKTIGTTANTSALYLIIALSAGTTLNTRYGGIGIQTNTFHITGVQLEQNYQPTPFEQRPRGTELALCQRYYQVSNASVGNYANAAGNPTAYLKTVVTMRTTPTLTVVTAPTYTNSSALTADQLSQDGNRFYISVSVLGVGYADNFVYSLSAEL